MGDAAALLQETQTAFDFIRNRGHEASLQLVRTAPELFETYNFVTSQNPDIQKISQFPIIQTAIPEFSITDPMPLSAISITHEADALNEEQDDHAGYSAVLFNGP